MELNHKGVVQRTLYFPSRSVRPSLATTSATNVLSVKYNDQAVSDCECNGSDYTLSENEIYAFI